MCGRIVIRPYGGCAGGYRIRPYGGCAGGYGIRPYGRVVLIQPETLDKARKLQARKHLARCSAVKSRVGKVVQRHMQRHLAANARKRLRKVRAFLAVFQLCAHRGGMLGGGQLLVNAVQRAVFANQLERGLFPDAGHAGNVVGAITHQSLDVHELLGLNAVFGKERISVHNQGVLIGGKQDVGGRIDELQGIAVTRQHQRTAIFRIVARHSGKRAENVVRLVALQLQHVQAQHGYDLLCNGHLRTQLVGHGVSARFVCVVHLVAEGGCLEVKRHSRKIGLVLLYLLRENIDHTVQRVGRRAVLGGQQPDAVKRAVEYAVSVDTK